LVTDILSDPAARASAFGLDNSLRLPFPVAVKTGTSKGYADNWTAGYTRERTVAIWVGNFDRRPMLDSSGITGAAPLFRRMMIAAMQERTPAPLTSVALHSVEICPLSGMRAGPDCPDRMEERFAPGTEPGPENVCTMHRSLSTASSDSCRHLARGQHFVTDPGPTYYGWASHQGDDRWRAAHCVASTDGKSPTPVTLLTPRAGDAFFLIDDLPLADQAIPVRVRAAASEATLQLQLDGKPAGVLVAPFEGHLAATPGFHLLTVHRPGDATPLAQARYHVTPHKSLSSN
jgi:penicillin-binding protein 1C